MNRPNPYVSPAHPADSDAPHEGGSQSLSSSLVFGLWAGILFGGTFGAAGAVLLGLCIWGTLGWQVLEVTSREGMLITEMVAAIVGAICGVVPGCVIGPFAAFLLYLTPSSQPKKQAWIVVLVTVILSALTGSLVGLSGTAAFKTGATDSAFLSALGAGVGAIAGSWGGLALARGIVAFRDDD